ncbi:MAG: TolC family protein [Bacillota bacterium]
MQGLKKWLAVLLLVSVSLVATGVGLAQKGPQAKELSLQQAIDLALKNNPDMALAKVDVDSAQAAYDGAKYTADAMDVDRVQTYEMGKLKWNAPAATKMALTLAKEKQKLQEKTLKLNVETAYYDVLKYGQLLEVKKVTLKYAKDQLKIAQDSLKVGSMSKGDVIGVEALVAASEAGVTSAQNDYDMAVMELNKLTGLELDTPLKLTATFEFVKAADIKVQDAVYEALANNIEIISVKEEKALKQVEFETAKKFLGGGVTSYETAKYAQQAADIKVKKQEQDTTLAVKKDYLTLLSLEQVINWNKKEVEKQQENQRIFGLKYKAGLATGQDVQKATIDLETARQKLAESIYNYNTLKSKFKYGLFVTGSLTASGSTGGSSGSAAMGG